MHSSKTKSLFMILFLIISFFLNSCLDSTDKNHQKLADPFDSLSLYGMLPEFSGVNDSGVSVKKKTLQKKIWLMSFFFTSCGDICPKLNAVQKSMVKKHISEKLGFISFTVDSEVDTPVHLKTHRSQMGFDDARWQFVRMDHDTILESFMNGMLVGYSDNPQNHSARFILIDTAFRIRGYFDALDKKQIDSLDMILNRMR